MREQTIRVETGAVKKKIIIAAVLALVLLGVAGVYHLLNPSYTPPVFEAAAQKGVPTPADNLGYGEISAQGGFSFSVAGTIYQQEDGSLLVYLTNPAGSEIHLMCEVIDAKGKAIYKSGAIKPGEYVERLQPLTELPDEAMEVEMHVYAFETDTWYSKGTVSLANTLQPY